MPGVLEDYGLLFQRYFNGRCIDPFFLYPVLLPGPRSEIRRQLLERLRQQPAEIRQAAAPIVRFLAHFVDDYQQYERDIPGFFEEVNAWMRDGIVNLGGPADLLASLAGESQTQPDPKALSIAIKFEAVSEAYWNAQAQLDRDLEALGVRKHT